MFSHFYTGFERRGRAAVVEQRTGEVVATLQAKALEATSMNLLHELINTNVDRIIKYFYFH